MRWVVVVDEGDRRRSMWEAGFARCNVAHVLVPWAEVARRPAIVGEVARPGDVLRVDSPGSDLEVWRALAGPDRRRRWRDEDTLGVWRPGRAWFGGLVRVIGEIEASTPGVLLTHPLREICDMVDKQACHRRLAAAGVPVPPSLEAPATVAELRARLAEVGWPAVFVKPRWGSSAAGVLAWRRGGGREQLTAPMRVIDGLLINHKQPETVVERSEIDARLAPILADGAVVERWIPKAGARGCTFDLRVVVIDGRVRHRVARLAAGPITNLHLDAERADADEVMAEVGISPGPAWAACEAAARAFPAARCVGIDLGIDVRGRPFVIEVNAWGDHLRRVEHEGEDTVQAQIRAVMKGLTGAGDA